MPTIRILPDSLVNKIAAGEVIVRPASVVKELVENALDAGARRIWVELGNACRDIRVRDDGCGMTREDAPLALLRHATSKIEHFEDLYELRTRGFRGEALASIAAVSRLTLLTRARGELAGTRVETEGGREPRVEAAGAPEGTDVYVRDLFFNTPARLKFLKSAVSELQQILTILTRQALIRPDVAFSVRNEKTSLMELPPDQQWAERITMLLGGELAEHLLEVDAERHGVRVRGFIVRPTVTRKDRRHQFFFVNGRPITNRQLAYVVQEAYRGVIMTQRFPILVLDLVMPAGEVDVNVHPTKEEVRFRNEAGVLGAVHRAVEERLRAANLLPTITFAESGQAPRPSPIAGATQSELLPTSAWLESEPSASMPGDFSRYTNHARTETAALRAALEIERIVKGETDLENALQTPSTSAQPEQTTPPATEDATTPCSVRPLQASLRRLEESRLEATAADLLLQGGSYPEPLGQIAGCYIVARAGDNLLLVDQHAAHERLLYMRLREIRGSATIAVQPLLIPVAVDVAVASLPLMQELLPIFESLGMKIEHFGGHTFLVQTLPADLANMDVSSVVSDVLDDMAALGSTRDVEVLRDRVLTRMACRAAIKAGQSLQLEEMRALLRDIVHARLGFTCPHGRPTMILLSREQLDRQFKRVV
ncbi:MAG: DNA mismatch repair endonuclease MutL [Candidatus Sumerlaea chitinivorans]|uniref:DNA mismatch repair protein MutL n=1 Tax=Sumerlaea chitinivorans TaxID=2250252 RepID=A0A2Z4Y8Q2_SUMC1|nr:DNA mismatch repair protein MutL [Candidatus Sumerlaea chitinivorans]MCX7963548.1 DNA mismatch repair endonuclease MutL [Candidatus Sumerlaea chitinivorans]